MVWLKLVVFTRHRGCKCGSEIRVASKRPSSSSSPSSYSHFYVGSDVRWHTLTCSTVVHFISRHSDNIIYCIQPSSHMPSYLPSPLVLSFPSLSFPRSASLFSSHAHIVRCLSGLNVHFCKKSQKLAQMTFYRYLSNPDIGRTFWGGLTPSN